jgi:hypothetical protein
VAAHAAAAVTGEAAAEEALAAGPTQLWCGKRFLGAVLSHMKTDHLPRQARDKQ